MAHDGPGDRVRRRALQPAGDGEHLVDVFTRRGDDVHDRHLAGGHRAGLVEQDGVDPARRLQHLRTLDEDAQLRPASGADQERRRRGQPEGARARDDQDGGRGGEGRRGVGADPEPETEGAGGEDEDDRDEDARDPVGEPLDGGLAGLRLLDQGRDLREPGLGADPGRPRRRAGRRR